MAHPQIVLYTECDSLAGLNHTCGVRTDGSVACWGADGDGESTPPAGTFLQVSAGYAFSCGVRADGSITCWGYDANNQLWPTAGMCFGRT